MEQFVMIERAIACPQASVAVAAETAAQALGQAGYRRGLGFGPTASYVRSYRPTWALVLAILGALPTLGLALLLLLYKTKDHCNVVIEDGPYGVVALVSGRVPASLPARLEGAVGHDHGQQMQGYHQQPPPMVLAPSGGYEQPPSHSPQAILRPATPVPPLSTADSPFPVPGSPFPVPAGQQQGGRQNPPPVGWPPPEAPRHPMPAHQLPSYERPDQQPQRQPEPQRPPEPQRQQGQPALAEQQQPAPAAAPAPVAFRPPSRLGPQPSAPVPGVNGSAGAAVNGSADGASRGAAPAAAESEDPFASTSGRVPWAVSGGRASVPPPAPPFAASAAPPPPPPPPPPPDQQRDGARAQPAAGGLATAVGDPTPVLRVDSGEVLVVGPFCLLGREPSARDGDPVAQLVKFDDTKLSVSKTHLAYGVDENGFWVTDRNSTNGTTVIEPSGQRIPCAPGTRHYVPVGGQVQIGQRRLTLEPADGAAAAS